MRRRADIQKALEHVKSVKDGQDVDAIKKAVAELSKASHKTRRGGLLRRRTRNRPEVRRPPAAAGTGDGHGKTEEKVVEAEFEEVDKDKK